MSKNVWERLHKESGEKGEPFFILAPMEAVTDSVFRRVVMKAGRPDLFFTEFTNAEGFNSPQGKRVVGQRLEYLEGEKPLIAQIWSSKPDEIAKMAKKLKKMGFDGIDLNMGCPAKTATKHESGAAMIRNPELAGKIIAAAKVGGLPVSVKTRLGYSKVEEWRGWLKFLLEQDIAALSIHARTKKEMSKVPAHLELLAEIVELRDEISPDTLIVANGDISNRREGRDVFNTSGVDGIMIGRGIFTNIFCFTEKEESSKEDLLGLLNYHLNLFEEACESAPYKKFNPIKRFFKIYIRDFDGASDLRGRLMECNNLPEVREILNAYDERE